MSLADSFRNPDLPIDIRTKDLLSRLSLREKVSQMVHDSPAIERLGIPAHNWWNECLHGVARAGIATVFPQAIGLAATFNPELLHRVAEAISEEARAKHHAHQRRGDHDLYKGLTYWTPNINVFRDPRWGRGQETYGECPYLTGRLGVAFVRGLQGDDPTHLKLVATPKHFAVHSGPEKDRHSFNARVGKKDLRETYLPAFRDCVVEAKAESIMGAYNRTNGEVCCASKTLLEDILRGEWGFEGHVVSDCGAIEDFHAHHKVTSTPEMSAALAVRRGCDLNCGCAYRHLLKAHEEGLISEQEIDRALARLLRARFRLGMFDPPERVPYAQISFDVIECPDHKALALEAARQSVVLLKNKGKLLPLGRDTRSIAVIGPNADDRQVLLGNYNGLPSTYATVLEGIRKMVSPATRVLYRPGCDHIGKDNPAWGKATKGFVEAELIAEQADAVVLCLGLTGQIEGEEGDAPLADSKGDRVTIVLPEIQEKLLKAILAVGKPTILVVMSGSAVAIPWAQEHVPAIIQQFYPGQEGGTALAEVLFGEVNPSGRLPVTVYRSESDLPPFEDYSMEGRTYRYFRGEPLYPFGFGLGYTRFAFSGLRVKSEVEIGQEPEVSVEVENTGGREGEEVVQLYLMHESPPVRMPVRQLVGFQRIRLEPGEKKRVSFRIGDRQMALVDEEGNFRLEPGSIVLFAGGSQPDPRSLALGAPPPVSARFRLIGTSKTLAP